MLARRLFAIACLFAALSPAPALTAQTKASTPSNKAAAAAPATPNGQVLDLNTATPQELKTLPGIGDAFAKKIIDGRPYTMKNQLTQRGILPEATYDKIKDSVVARRVTGGAQATKSR